jgi:hypothetical protein
MAFAVKGADLWGAVCLPIPGAASIVGTGDIFGDRLAEPIHILRRGVRLSKRHCDAGFGEGIEDGVRRPVLVLPPLFRSSTNA